MEAVDKVMETAPSEVVRVATVDGKMVEVRHKVSLFQKMSKEAVKDVAQEVEAVVAKRTPNPGVAMGSSKNETQYVSKTVNGRSFLEIQHPVVDSVKTGSALKIDPHHAFDSRIDNFVRDASKFLLKGADGIVRELYQLEGSIDGVSGVFEWIVDPCLEKGITHRLFIRGGNITGMPNMIPKK